MEESVLRGKHVLVVDDEVDLREIVASELDFMGSQVEQAGNIANADSILKQKKVDLIISDIRMPGGTGVELLKTVKARNILNPPVVLITGFADITPEEAYAEGAEALLSKPFQLDDLIQVSERLLRPLETRFTQGPAAGNKTLSYESGVPVKQTSHFELGRGGFYVRVENNQKYEIGDPITISLKFPDVHLKGVGVPRWSKLADEDGKLCLGIEILKVEDECAQYLMNYWKSSPGLAFIPKAS
jgi:CheY-like chemotaxis protein